MRMPALFAASNTRKQRQQSLIAAALANWQSFMVITSGKLAITMPHKCHPNPNHSGRSGSFCLFLFPQNTTPLWGHLQYTRRHRRNTCVTWLLV